MQFAKPPKSFDEQVDLLIERGMVVKDRDRAKRYLAHLTSFLHHLSIVRNTCAHHARLWNRSFPFAWKLPRKRPSGMGNDFNHHDGKRLYNTLIMLAYLMDSINPNIWKHRLGNLFARHPDVKPQAMGFPDDWQERLFRVVYNKNQGE